MQLTIKTINFKKKWFNLGGLSKLLSCTFINSLSLGCDIQSRVTANALVLAVALCVAASLPKSNKSCISLESLKEGQRKEAPDQLIYGVIYGATNFRIFRHRPHQIPASHAQLICISLKSPRAVPVQKIEGMIEQTVEKQL